MYARRKNQREIKAWEMDMNQKTDWQDVGFPGGNSHVKIQELIDT